MSVDPENHSKVVEAVEPLVEATLAEEGNVTYGFWAHPTESGLFRIHEEWVDQAAIDEHMASAHMAAFLAALADADVTSTELTLHEVASSNRFM